MASIAGQEGKGRARRLVLSVNPRVLVFLGVAGILKGMNARQAQRQFEAISQQASALADDGKLQPAIAQLKTYPAKFKKTPWQAKINDSIAELETRAVRETVRARHKLFLKAVAADDKNAALRTGFGLNTRA